MSTNKAQGQMLDFVGLCLSEHVFSHMENSMLHSAEFKMLNK